jgi:hypothetical protein
MMPSIRRMAIRRKASVVNIPLPLAVSIVRWVVIIVVPLLWGAANRHLTIAATPPFALRSRPAPRADMAAAINLRTSAMGVSPRSRSKSARAAKPPLSFNARLQPVIGHARYLVGC